MPNDDVRERQQHLLELRGRISKYDRKTEKLLHHSVRAIATIPFIWFLDWMLNTEGSPGQYIFNLAVDFTPLLAAALLLFTLPNLLFAYHAKQRATERYRELRNEDVEEVIAS